MFSRSNLSETKKSVGQKLSQIEWSNTTQNSIIYFFVQFFSFFTDCDRKAMQKCVHTAIGDTCTKQKKHRE